MDTSGLNARGDTLRTESGDTHGIPATRGRDRAWQVEALLAAVLSMTLLISGALAIYRARTSVPATYPVPAAVSAAPIATAGRAVPASTRAAATRVVVTTAPKRARASPTVVPATKTPIPTRVPRPSRRATTIGAESAATAVPPSPAQESADPETATAAELIRRVAATEASVRSGQLEARIEYADGDGSTATVLFDLGEEGRPARLHSTSTHTSGGSVQAAEFVIVGDRSWQRGPEDRWTVVPELEGAWGQVQAYLPHAASAAHPRLADGPDLDTLRWNDAARGTEVTLRVDAVTGIPRELRRVDRVGRAVLRVTYSGWNEPVDIGAPPDG
jgi:hypothetical protein